MKRIRLFIKSELGCPLFDRPSLDKMHLCVS